MDEVVWRILPGLSIETASWDQQLVLFNNLSGDTYLLNKPVDWVLDQIALRPRKMDELIELAIKQGILVEESNNRKVFASLFKNLENIDLLESLPS